MICKTNNGPWHKILGANALKIRNNRFSSSSPFLQPSLFPPCLYAPTWSPAVPAAQSSAQTLRPSCSVTGPQWINTLLYSRIHHENCNCIRWKPNASPAAFKRCRNWIPYSGTIANYFFGSDEVHQSKKIQLLVFLSRTLPCIHGAVRINLAETKKSFFLVFLKLSWTFLARLTVCGSWGSGHGTQKSAAVAYTFRHSIEEWFTLFP